MRRRGFPEPLVLALLLLTSFGLGPARGQEQVLFDFEQGDLKGAWTAVRKIEAARTPVPEPAAKVEDGPDGQGLWLTSPGEGGLFSQPGKVPADWQDFAELSFWLYRTADEAAQHPVSTLDVQVLESDGKTKFWRKLVVDHTGWKKVTVPLRWMQFGSGRMPRWDQIARVGIWCRDPVKICLDELAVQPGPAPKASRLSTEELISAAFPLVPAEQVQKFETAELRVLTDARDLEVGKLGEHLDKVLKRLKTDLPLSPAARDLPTLIVFARQSDYEQFPVGIAKRLNASAAPPTSGGFTFHGLATSYWDPDKGTLRPVYTHEFVHSALSQLALLPNQGEWLQEGLANYYQLGEHPQENFAELVRVALEQPNLRWPLNDLCAGDRVPLNRYWQTVTVAAFLLKSPAYREKLPALFRDVQTRGTSDLRERWTAVFGQPLERVEQDWQAFCAREYAAAK